MAQAFSDFTVCSPPKAQEEETAAQRTGPWGLSDGDRRPRGGGGRGGFTVNGRSESLYLQTHP